MPIRRSGRRFGALFAVVVFAAVVTASTDVQAQDNGQPSARDLIDQFGGFNTAARAAGLSIAYDSPGLIPGTPSPLLQVGLPEASSNYAGDTGYALGSLVYPGPLLADLGPVIAQSGYDVPVPPYPVRTQAFYPTGPTNDEQTVGAAQMVSDTTETGSNALAVYGSALLQGLLDVASISTSTDTHVEEGQVVSRSRVELGDISILAGLIHIDSLTTDLVANSNGSDAASDGGTTISGVSLLGLPATLDATGLHLGPQPGAPTTTTPDPTGGVLGKLGLGKVADVLKPVVDGLNQLLATVEGSAANPLDSLLQMAGITLRVLEPVETKSNAQVDRLANALQIELHYDGRTTPVMSQLLALIPSDKLPSDPLIPQIPFNTSPQNLVELFKATHIFTIGIGVGHVQAVATPAFEFTPITKTPTGVASRTSTSPSSGTRPFSPSQFTTPTPGLGAGSPTDQTVGGSPIGFAATDPLAAAAIGFLFVLTAAVAWLGSGRLADNVLAPAMTACPEGLDQPPAGGSSP